MRKRTRVRLVPLSNTGCMINCPIRAYHSTITSHAKASLELGAYVDYPLLWCTKEKMNDPAQMVKSPLIRPEDLHVYEELGIEEFKLAGREMDRGWNERVIRAYAARRYDGDLNDLILGFDQMEPYGSITVRIANRAMDGFIDFFQKKHDCRVGCRDCRYCDDWAAKHCLRRRPRFVRQAHCDRARALRGRRVPNGQRALSALISSAPCRGRTGSTGRSDRSPP